MAKNEIKGGLNKILSVLDGDPNVALTVVKGLNSYISAFSKSGMQLEKQQMNFARSVGMSRDYAMQEARNMLTITNSNLLDRDYGFTGEKATQALSSFRSNIGRTMSMSKTDLENYAAGDVLFGDNGQTMSELAATYTQLGLNLENAGKDMGELFSTAEKKGLSFKDIAGTVKNHIKEANQYGFKNGINGLKQMATIAQEIGMDMQQILNASDKMNNLAGVADVSAKLSVLGGQFQSLSNPLEMMNESLTDVESLQKRIGDMFKGMAKFDSKRGIISVSAVDRMRINAAADALGIDKKEAFKSVETQGRRDLINRQIGNGLSEDIKTLLANTGYIQDGRAGFIDKNNNFRDVTEIANSQELQAELRLRSQNRDDKLSSIVQSLNSNEDYQKNMIELVKNINTQSQFGKKEREGVDALLREYKNAIGADTQAGPSFMNDILKFSSNYQAFVNERVGDIKGVIRNLNTELSNINTSIQNGIEDSGILDKVVQGVARGVADGIQVFREPTGQQTHVSVSSNSTSSSTTNTRVSNTSGNYVSVAPIVPTSTVATQSTSPYTTQSLNQSYNIDFGGINLENQADKKNFESGLKSTVETYCRQFMRDIEIKQNIKTGGR